MTDYRALCAELADALEEWQLGGAPPEDTADADLIARARAALAQPEPEGLDDDEIDEEAAAVIPWLLEAAVQAANSDAPYAAGKLTLAAQLLGERRPAVEPVPVSERLLGPEEVEELIQCLRSRGHSLTQEGASLRDRGDGIYFGRAADMLTLLARPAIKPVPNTRSEER